MTRCCNDPIATDVYLDLIASWLLTPSGRSLPTPLCRNATRRKTRIALFAEKPKSAATSDCCVLAISSIPVRAASRHGTARIPGSADRRGPADHYFFFVGSFLRLVLARSRSCFSDIDSAIFLEGPFKLDFFCSPRLAAKAAPAAFCCFFERAGIPLYRFAPEGWTHLANGDERSRESYYQIIGTSEEEVNERA